jgi:hypothetical protein
MSAIGFASGLGLGQRRRRKFAPGQVFAGGEQGAWFDPSDLATLSQDSAGTVAAAVDAPVGRIADKSGRGNHAVQATSGLRPMLRQDGAGKLYLQFDGADDWLRALFTIAQPFERLAAIRFTAADANTRHIFGGGTLLAGVLFHHTSVPSLSISSPTTAATRTDLPSGVTGVTSERFDGAASRLQVNASAFTSGNPGASLPGGVTLGGRHDGLTTGGSNLRLYGMVMRAGIMSDFRAGQLRKWLADKAGVAL